MKNKLWIVVIAACAFFVVPNVSFAQTFNSNVTKSVKNNSEVKKIQNFLKGIGYYDGAINGNFDQLTKNSVAVFQKREGAKVTFNWDKQTRTLANKIFDSFHGIDVGGEENQNSTDVILDVPFVSQIPTGDRKNPRFADGCEEASILMSKYYYSGERPPREQQAGDIVAITQYEEQIFGFHQDTSAADTARLAREIYGLDAQVSYGINVVDIRDAVAAGPPVIVTINAHRIGYYGAGGPPRHTIVVKGYLYSENKFVINDPLLSYGANLYVRPENLQAALRDYPSGVHRAVSNTNSAMIVVRK